jgi:hypothetical protein
MADAWRLQTVAAMLPVSHRGPPLEACDVRRLSLAWIGALVVLAGIAGGGCWLAIRSADESDDSRLLLAVGRQHMLSQRVALLAQQYVAAEDEYARLDLRWELRTCASEMLRTVERHLQAGTAPAAGAESGPGSPEEPLTRRPLSAAVTALYQDPPAMLEYHLTELSDSVHQLCGADTDLATEPELAATVEARARALLPFLDRLVEQLRQEHVVGVERHEALLLRIFASTVAALIVAGILLAGPGLRMRVVRDRPRAARRAAEPASVRRAEAKVGSR